MRGRPIKSVKKNKRGEGRGQDYVAGNVGWEFRSKAALYRWLGWKHRREYTMLSKGEEGLFLCLEWNPTVTEIREQFPLDREETMAIARQIGVRPSPLNIKGDRMTLDFLVTVTVDGVERHYARNYKTSEDLLKPRALELAEIERLYFLRRNIDWGIVTELDVPWALVENMKLIHDCRDLGDMSPLTATDIDRIATRIVPSLLGGRQPLNRCALNVDRALKYEPGTGLRVVWHLIAIRQLAIDMGVVIDPNQRVRFFKPSATVSA